MKIICFVVADDPAAVHRLGGGPADDPAAVHRLGGGPADDPAVVHRLGDGPADDPAVVHHLGGGPAVRHLVVGDPVGVPFGHLFDRLVVGVPSLVCHLGDDLTYLLRAVPLAWPVALQLGSVRDELGECRGLP